MNSLFLKPGREKSALQGHPWIFSGAAARVEGDPQPGDTLALRSAKGDFIAWAAYSPHSQIRARVWTLDEREAVGVEFFRKRLQAALRLRQTVVATGETDALRLVHGESDGIPGLVVDRYGDVLVLQALSYGVERWRDALVDLLAEETGAKTIYERSDVDVRALEGLPQRSGLLFGAPPSTPLCITENGLKFRVDVTTGQKTGFYVDQRRNRHKLAAYASGREMLNCFCYSGGFTVYGLAAGASRVLSIDSSEEAVGLAQQNVALNGLPEDRCEWSCADVFQALRKLRDQGRSFDLIVLDPPKFAPTAAQANRAARGYKDINLLAFKLLRPGGALFTFSCSGGVSADLFQKIVAGAALDAQVDAQIVERMAQGADHPVSLRFPEGEYLKGLVCVRNPAA